MTPTEIADEIYRELDEPSDTNISSITFWLQSNVGKLNNAIDTEINVDPISLLFAPDIGVDEKDIFKALYGIQYITRQIRKNLGAAAYDANVVEVEEGNRRVRTISRNEIAKVYQTMKNELVAELNDMIFRYKYNRANPLQVVGDDTVAGAPGLGIGIVPFYLQRYRPSIVG